MSKFQFERKEGRDYHEQPHWNEGVGRSIRSAVKDEESSVYDELDSLPKRTSNGKRLGRYGHRWPKIDWKKIQRWIEAQTGRNVDEVFSEFLKLAKDRSDEHEIQRMREAFFHDLTDPRGEIELCYSKKGGYPYLGIVTPEGHISYAHWSRRNKIYINSKGIISKIPQQKFKELERARTKQKEEIYSQRVFWSHDRAFICLQNQWFEVIFKKVDYASLGWRAYYGTKCVLCKKLKKNWYHDHFMIFGRDVAAVALRSMSYNDVEKFLI